MARIRSIKPELATSRKLARAPIEARYTLVLLITQADDEGFVFAEPRQLLGALYPHDESVTPDALESWIMALVKCQSIVLRWTSEGARVIQLLGWAEHQAVKNPGKPKISPLLLPLSVDSTETRQKTSIAEVVLSEVGGSEVGRGKTEVSEASPSADLSENFPDPEHRSAYLAYRRSHRMPDGLDATLRSLHAPMTGGAPLSWPAIGAALVHMRGVAAAFSPNAVAGFARNLNGSSPNGTEPYESTADGLARLAREGKL